MFGIFQCRLNIRGRSRIVLKSVYQRRIYSLLSYLRVCHRQTPCHWMIFFNQQLFIKYLLCAGMIVGDKIGGRNHANQSQVRILAVAEIRAKSSVLPPLVLGRPRRLFGAACCRAASLSFSAYSPLALPDSDFLNIFLCLHPFLLSLDL